MDLVLFALSFIIILAGCEFFTNGVEWAGKKLKLTQSAVGSLLAAIGTALPETILPLVAILSLGGEAGKDIGTGSILGSPFTLSTLALFLCGFIALMSMRKHRYLEVDGKMVRKNLGFFIGAYSLAVVAAFLPLEYGFLKYVIALILAAIYVLYAYSTLKADGLSTEDGEVKPLYTDALIGRLTGKKNGAEYSPSTILIALQVLISLAAIVIGANVFVNQVEGIAIILGISPLILSLLIAPMATELPEMFNSLIWIKEGKDVFALGNILGAMVYQSCILVIIGILLTGWHFDLSNSTQLLQAVSIAMALLSSAVLYLFSSKDRIGIWSLMAGGIFYLALIVLVLIQL